MLKYSCYLLFEIKESDLLVSTREVYKYLPIVLIIIALLISAGIPTAQGMLKNRITVQAKPTRVQRIKGCQMLPCQLVQSGNFWSISYRSQSELEIGVLIILDPLRRWAMQFTHVWISAKSLAVMRVVAYTSDICIQRLELSSMRLDQRYFPSVLTWIIPGAGYTSSHSIGKLT